MLQQDLEKRLEEIETKIEELEDMVLDNKLKIMNLYSKLEEKKSSVVKFETVEKRMTRELEEKIKPLPVLKPRETRRTGNFFKPKETKVKQERNLEDLNERAKKIKSMLRELE